MDQGNQMVGAMMHLKKKGRLRLVIIGFVVGIAMLLIGSVAFSEDEKKQEEDTQFPDRRQIFSEYKEELCLEVESICRSVSGVRSAPAVVYFDGLGESIYAQNTQAGNVEKSEYVIIGSGSGSHALYIGESLPPLSGIGVVCDTGGNASVRNEVSALLSATYGLPLTRVYVSEGG